MVLILRYIVIIHIAISLGFFVFSIKPRGIQESIFRFMVVFFLPIAGILYFLISSIAKKTVKSSDKNIREYIDYIEDLSHIHYVKDIDFEKEINVIPAEDSLRFNEKKTRRSYIIYILKKDFKKHVESLKKALNNEDSETAHYAAAALMEIKNQFEEILENLKRKYRQNSSDIQNLQDYIGILKKYIRSGLLEKTGRIEHLRLYSRLLGELLSIYDESKSYFMDKINADLDLRNYQQAKKYCRIFENRFPNEADPIIMSMKVHYAQSDYKGLFSDLDRLKSSGIPLESKEKDMVSFWEGSKSGVY